MKAAFEAEGAPKGIVWWVGQRAEWRDKENVARVRFDVHNVPTVLKLQEVSRVLRVWSVGKLQSMETLIESVGRRARRSDGWSRARSWRRVDSSNS